MQVDARPAGRRRNRPDHHRRRRRSGATSTTCCWPLRTRWTGLTVVVDCAHGAASTVAPEAYRRAGAKVIVIAGEPDGLNINDGVGSTHLDQLRAAVVAHGADLGIAHDGDADRCLAVDAAGEVVDGDPILAILAISMHARGELVDGTVVTTVMANLGFHRAMRRPGHHGADHRRRRPLRARGDARRRVLARRRAVRSHRARPACDDRRRPVDGALPDGADGATGRTLADLASVVTKFPQVLLNVRVADKAAVAASPSRSPTPSHAAEAELGDSGRVLLRPSGTEALVRVMVEAGTADAASGIAERIAAVVGAQ